uniref:Uncharacterized protein n=1 Tax=Daphnia galeata TaxID=27404 RepID=A0A8J2RG31_9CRUS|nr:unnamed protein product [Daphnia galeata]
MNDLIGLLINFSFGKSNKEATESGDGIVDDIQTDMQIVLRNQIEDQTIVIGRMEFAMSGLDRNTFEKGKTVIRVKGVNITKQTFPLKGDLFQDSVLQINLSSSDMPLPMVEWMAILNDNNEESEEEKDGKNEES